MRERISSHMIISSFCFLDTQTFTKHSCAGGRVLSAVLHENTLITFTITFAIITIELYPGHISKKAINQYPKLNSSQIMTTEITLILLILKAYRIQQYVE